jgi:hypothetical protein
VKDVQTKLLREECAKGMEQRTSNAAVKDAKTVLSKEEYALHTELR